MTHKDERVLSVAELARVEGEGALYIRALRAWVLLLAAHAWFVYGNKPISESEIKREIERQAGPAR
jgi:hypothetical protein